jgi:hypothetical protein
MAAAQRQALGRLDEALRPFGIFLEFHDAFSPLNRPQRPLIRQPRNLSRFNMV